VHHLAVPHSPDSAGVVRRTVVSELRARGIDEQLVGDAAVIVSELVGNAIRHGRPLPDGTLHAGWNVNRRMLHVEVQDGGGGPPDVIELPDEYAVGGRGLMIIEALSHSWGVRPADGGTSVWVEMPIVPAAGRRRAFGHTG
jgi:serine/threonine-protein kinase RsbW